MDDAVPFKEGDKTNFRQVDNDFSVVGDFETIDSDTPIYDP